MKRFLLLLVLTPSLALAQNKVPSNAQSQRGGSVPVTAIAEVDANGYLVEPGALAPATSIPLIGSFTGSGVTPTSGTATFASGTAKAGPFVPILGRDIALRLWGAGPFSCQLFNSDDGGTTLYPLTIFDTPIGGPYTSAVNSAITSESVAGVTYWLTCTGTGSYKVTQ